MRRLVAIVLVAVACTQPSVLWPSPSPSSTASPTQAAIFTPGPTTNPFGFVQAFPLGDLRGDWVFAIRESTIPILGGAVQVELLALPIVDNKPRVVLSFVQPAGGVNFPFANG